MQHCFRRIHLDFHTSPYIPAIGQAFEEEEFAATLQRAHVGGICCFAKCHHGLSYYDTKVGRRHPFLEFDLLRRQIRAVRRAGIKISAYYSVVWEYEAAEKHPDWCQVTREGEVRGAGQGRFAWLCLNSPYVEELVHPQVEELLEYDLDGFFFDALLTHDCHCPWCQEVMREKGWDYGCPEDVLRLNEFTVLNFMARTTGLIRARRPERMIEYNNQVRLGARRAAKWMSSFGIEAPVQALGFLYYPFYSRHVRTLGLPFNGYAVRFHTSWGDQGSLTTPAQIHHQVATFLASGGHASIGDHCHPCGRLEPAVYETIAPALADVERKEPWLREAVGVAEVALLGDWMEGQFGAPSPSDAHWGAAQVLLECHQQFDVIDPEADFSPYRLLVLPDHPHLDEALAERINAFVEAGGKVLATGQSSLDRRRREYRIKSIGVEYISRSPFSQDYFRVVHPALARGVPDLEYICYEPMLRIAARPGIEVLAKVVEPFFERSQDYFSGHTYTPASRVGAMPPAITRCGDTIYSAAPLFTAYYRHGMLAYRNLLRNCLDLLLPDPLVRTDAAADVEVSLTRQPGRFIVHLVNYHTGKRGRSQEVIEELPPRFDLTVSLRLPQPPRRVYLAPTETPLDCRYADGYATVRVPRLDVHEMVVWEEK